MTTSLNSLRVLVTRPKPQGEILCQLIRDAGGDAIYFPTIDIIATPQTGESDFSAYDWVIFISPQAVYHTSHAAKFPAVAAVGLSTAQALEQRQIAVAAYPSDEWSTEGLLKLSVFQQLSGKKILIIKGEGGRELLAQTLELRGAKIFYHIVYQRVLPKTETKSINLLLNEHKIDIIVITSIEGIQNLMHLLGAKNRSSLLKIPLLVVSARLKEYANGLGFTSIKIANNASNQDILESLRGIEHDRRNSSQ